MVQSLSDQVFSPPPLQMKPAVTEKSNAADDAQRRGFRMEFAQAFGSSSYRSGRVCIANSTLYTGGVQTAKLRETFTDVTESCLAKLNTVFPRVFMY